jgi:hypothetical protein
MCILAGRGGKSFRSPWCMTRMRRLVVSSAQHPSSGPTSNRSGTTGSGGPRPGAHTRYMRTNGTTETRTARLWACLYALKWRCGHPLTSRFQMDLTVQTAGVIVDLLVHRPWGGHRVLGQRRPSHRLDDGCKSRLIVTDRFTRLPPLKAHTYDCQQRPARP